MRADYYVPESSAGTEDLLGVLEATMASEGDEFIPEEDSTELSIDSQSTVVTRSESDSYSDALELPASPSFDQSAAFYTPDGESSDDDVAIVASTDVLHYPEAKSEDEEVYYYQSLLTLIQDNWNGRVINGFQSLSKTVLGQLSEETRGTVEKEFLQFLSSPPPFRCVLDPTVFYRSFGSLSISKQLFSYVALSVVNSPCSECSCERVFSLVKWIVGDRRRQLRLRTLSLLLQVIVNMEMYDTITETAM